MGGRGVCQVGVEFGPSAFDDVNVPLLAVSNESTVSREEGTSKVSRRGRDDPVSGITRWFARQE